MRKGPILRCASDPPAITHYIKHLFSIQVFLLFDRMAHAGSIAQHAPQGTTDLYNRSKQFLFFAESVEILKIVVASCWKATMPDFFACRLKPRTFICRTRVQTAIQAVDLCWQT